MIGSYLVETQVSYSFEVKSQINPE